MNANTMLAENASVCFDSLQNLVRVNFKGTFDSHTYDKAMQSCYELMKVKHCNNCLLDQLELEEGHIDALRWISMVWRPYLEKEISKYHLDKQKLAILTLHSNIRIGIDFNRLESQVFYEENAAIHFLKD